MKLNLTIVQKGVLRALYKGDAFWIDARTYSRLERKGLVKLVLTELGRMAAEKLVAQ